MKTREAIVPQEGNMPSLVVDRLAKRYGRIQALRSAGLGAAAWRFHRADLP